MTFRRLSAVQLLSAASLVLAMFAVLTVRPASAGPVTAPGTSPYVKLGVYQGVVSVADASGRALEIGNAGRDIAGTSDIYLRPGGLSQANGLRLAKSNAFAEAGVFLGTGSICLNTTGVANPTTSDYTCYSSWSSGSGGDLLWTAAGSVLSPAATATPISTIRIGSATNPVPQSNGRGLDVYGSFSPVLQTSGDYGYLMTGYSYTIGTCVYSSNDGASCTTDAQCTGSAPDYFPYCQIEQFYRGGNVHIQGQLRVDLYGGSTGNSFQLLNSNIVPWTSYDSYDREWLISGISSDLQPTGIDADTFDGIATLPFSTDNNLFWKWPNTPATHNGQCNGGTRSGLTCDPDNYGTDCPSTPTSCVGMGTCPTDTIQCFNGACTGGVNNGLACVTVADCPATICSTSTNTCVGGANAGNACTSVADCPARCVGGTFNGQACTSNVNCHGSCDANAQAPGALCYPQKPCNPRLTSCTNLSKPALCLRAETASGFLCTGGTNPGKPCTGAGDTTTCGAGGTCTQMCGSTAATCAADPQSFYHTTVVQPASPSLICLNGGKRYTHFCRGGTAPAYPNSHACEYDAQCTALYGGASSCELAQVSYGCNGPAGYGHACDIDADCAPYGNAGCGKNNCEGNGVPRFINPGSVVLQPGNFVDHTGFCWHDENKCTSDNDCTIRNTSGAIVENGLCASMGFCSQGSVTNGNYELGGTKFCVGGTRATRDPGLCSGGVNDGRTCQPNHPADSYTQQCIAGGGTCVPRRINCSQVNLCIGGSGDSLYDDRDGANITACTDRGGRIGNAVDYCPDGGTCTPDLYCFSSNDCYNASACIRGMAHPFTGTSDPATCANYCQQIKINRCRGATDVYGVGVNSCSTYGTDPRYTTGTVVGYTSGATTYSMCDCTTTQKGYGVASTSSADICTPEFTSI